MAKKKNYTVKVDWDVDDKSDLKYLPKTVEIPGNVDEEDVSDYLSDEYGFCVNAWVRV